MSHSASVRSLNEIVVQNDDVEDESIPLVEQRNDQTHSWRNLSPPNKTVYSSLSPSEYCSKYDIEMRDGEADTTAHFERRRRFDVQNLNTQLLEAILKDNSAEIKRCVQQGASPNAVCRLNNVSACHIAASREKNYCLYVLLELGAERIRYDKFGRSPLHVAAWAGNPKKIAMLLDWPDDLQDKIDTKVNSQVESLISEFTASADVINHTQSDYSDSTVPDEWKDDIIHNCRKTEQNLPKLSPGWTPLHAACLRAQYKCVQVLLAAGADPFKADSEGRTALDITGHAYYSDETIDAKNFKRTIRILLDRGVRFGPGTPSQLHIAVALGCEETVRELLNAGFPVRGLNSAGVTAMHICVEKKNAEFLSLIAKFESNNPSLPRVDEFRYPERKAINAKVSNGFSVLHAAVQKEWVYGVLIALQCGANISAKTNDGDLPIHIAATNGAIKIMKFLIREARYDTNVIDICDRDGYTALFIAIKNNNLEAVKMLWENGASLRITEDTTHKRLNCLHVAALHGRVEILKYFFSDLGECVESLINDMAQANHYTPIVYAIINNHAECVSLLLEKGAQIDMSVLYADDIHTGQIWTTPCHIAASKNYLSIVKLLLNKDKKIMRLQNSAKYLPLHEACIKSHQEIISELIDNGADLGAEHETVMTPMEALLRNMIKPEIYLETVFDSYIIGKGLEDRNFEITVDYKMLLPDTSGDKQMRVIKSLSQASMAHNQTELLQHPLIESFLFLKWKAFLPYFRVTLGIYIWFLFSLNIFTVSAFYYNDNIMSNITNVTNITTDVTYTPIQTFSVSKFWVVMIYLSSIAIVLQESIFYKDVGYLLSLETIVKYGAIGFSVVLPIFVMDRISITEIQLVRLIATVAILLSWLEMMFLLSRFPQWGYYVLILVKVTGKVLKVMLTCIFLIIGFAFAFMIQFRSQSPFQEPLAAITKTFVMMTSEFDYSSTVSNNDPVIVSLQRLVFLIFIIFGSVVLMNVMVGVAVNDVNELESLGMTRRLQKQIDFLTSFEEIKTNPSIHRFFGRFASECCRGVCSRNINMPKSITIRTADPTCIYNQILPKHIKEALIEKIYLKREKKKDEKDSAEQKSKLDKIQESIDKLAKRVEKIIDDIEDINIYKLNRPTYDDSLSVSS